MKKLLLILFMFIGMINVNAQSEIKNITVQSDIVIK